MTGATDRNGKRRTFGYDNAGRRTTEKWLDSGGNTIRTLTWTYDAAGQLTLEQDPDSKYAITYDTLGRVTNVDTLGTPGLPRVILTIAYDGYLWSVQPQIAKKIKNLATFSSPYPPTAREVPRCLPPGTEKRLAGVQGRQ